MTSIARHRPGLAAIVAAGLPLLLGCPLLLGMRGGPVLRLGASSVYHLDLWSVLVIVASCIVVVPGTIAAVRWRGAWAGVAMVGWLSSLSAFAFWAGTWIS
jgi:hypothetical protein